MQGRAGGHPMSLPKKPVAPKSIGSVPHEIALVDALIKHEHAVAKRAVEALRAFIEANDKGSSMEWVNRMAACDREVRKVLREIELSGWTP